MFIEPQSVTQKSGWIEVICGSMFSGKTEELIRRLKRAKIALKKIQAFKPKIDDRYHKDLITSHDENNFISVPIHHADDILQLLQPDTEVVAVDETQFFDHSIVNVLQQIAFQNKRVIVAGLDMDYSGQPFGHMPEILAVAEYVTKLHAICVVCGGTAQFSYRLKKEQHNQVLVGAHNEYEARCRKCFLL